MSASSADVFRLRQSVSDLSASMQSIGLGAIARLSPTDDVRRTVARRVAGTPRFSFPEDQHCYSDVLLAAAMPDEDFPAFVLATCLLLADRLLGGDGTDDLFWNWDAFAEHYQLADPPVRAAVLNGFRLADALGHVSMRDSVPEPGCYTRSVKVVLAHLDNVGRHDLAAAVIDGVTPEEAGHLWTLTQGTSPGWVEMSAFRCLYERPQSISPPDPSAAPLIAWN